MAEFRHMPLLARIPDAPSARYLVRMSGLPVFLAGVVCWLTLLNASRPADLAVSGGLGLALVALGLVLRAGNTWAVPFVALISAGWIGFTLWTTLPLFAVTIILWPPFLTALAFLLIQLIVVGIFAISGLRGWLWLRGNR